MEITKLTTEFCIFEDAYFKCAVQSESGDAESPLGVSAHVTELAPETRVQMRIDCLAFFGRAGSYIAGHESQAGEDFWLSRRGHGAGFWSGLYWSSDRAEKLDKIAESFGDCELVRGFDNLIRIA